MSSPQILILGSNQFINCDAVLTIMGTEIFRLRERDTDGRLEVDFDLYGKAGDRIFRVARVAKNRVVYRHPNFEVLRDADEHTVRGPVGNIVLSVHRLRDNVVRVDGDFYYEKCSILARGDYLVLNTPAVRDAFFSRTTVVGRKGLVIDDESVSIL